MNGMQLTFFGVRGSYPVAGCQTVRYGGNSASILVESQDQTLILDAGTGIIGAGRYLLSRRSGPKQIPIFLTHLHIDHIQGLPFFPPVYDPEYSLSIFCPVKPDVDLEKTIQTLFLPPFSPVSLEGIRARIEFHPLSVSGVVRKKCGDLQVECLWHDFHPLQGSSICKITCGKRTVAYATDLETPDGLTGSLCEFIRDCDVLIHDAQYRDRDYFGNSGTYRGFGHSPVSAAARNAAECGARKLFLFHYDPEYDDRVLESMLREARKLFPATHLAQESLKINIRS